MTGYLVILSALWLSRAARVARQLDADRILISDDGFNAAGFLRTRMRRWQRAGALGVGLVVTAGFVFFYYISWMVQEPAICADHAVPRDRCNAAMLDHAQSRTPFILVSACFAFVTGHRLGTLAASSTLAVRLSKPDIGLRVVPGHPGGAGGFRQLGDMVGMNGGLALRVASDPAFFVPAAALARAVPRPAGRRKPVPGSQFPDALPPLHAVLPHGTGRGSCGGRGGTRGAPGRGADGPAQLRAAGGRPGAAGLSRRDVDRQPVFLRHDRAVPESRGGAGHAAHRDRSGLQPHGPRLGWIAEQIAAAMS
ncbi:hypothetical protein [Mangrovicoccus ximenensis]|uniref:hypothetical protein n=1 Tax=Mangrovicoccus ximenensis TaxID=1911570 RepID=UPI0011AE8636|nr:hypothetical protein [Mangrovicoccus ximenensis]